MNLNNENRTEKNKKSISTSEFSDPKNVLDDEILKLNPEQAVKTEIVEFNIGNTAVVYDKEILVSELKTEQPNKIYDEIINRDPEQLQIIGKKRKIIEEPNSGNRSIKQEVVVFEESTNEKKYYVVGIKRVVSATLHLLKFYKYHNSTKKYFKKLVRFDHDKF